MAAPAYPVELSPAFRRRRQALRQGFDKWKRAFGSFRQQDPSRSAAILTLHVSNLALDIILDTCLVQDEMIFDHFSENFKRIVTISEELLTRAPRHAKSNQDTSRSLETESSENRFSTHNAAAEPMISMNIGILPHLYMTATRCREPVIRHKALGLLKASKTREGICDSNMCAAFAEKLIIAEENGARMRLQFSKADKRVDLMSAVQVPDEVRVRVLDQCPSDLVW